MDRAQKVEAVKELSDIFAGSGIVVVADYGGITVSEMSALRNRMREGGARFKVAKNRLAKIALDGTPQDVVKDLFTGQTGIAFSDDPISAPKAAKDCAKRNEKFEILGGVMGDRLLNEKDIAALADMPSVDELRARLIGTLQAPMVRMAGVLKAAPVKFLGILAAKETKDGEAGQDAGDS